MKPGGSCTRVARRSHYEQSPWFGRRYAFAQSRFGGYVSIVKKSFAPSVTAALIATLLALAPARAQDERIVSPLGAVEELAALIGGAHYLRITCDRDDFTWREQMLALVDVEVEGDDRRQRRLVSAFNDGYRAQERLHARCNAETRRAEAELAAEGKRLAETLRDRYLN